MRSPLPQPATIERELRRSWPEAPVRKMRVEQSGWTNLMFEVDGRWMVRVPRWRSSARSLDYEIRLLDLLASRTSIRIPSPEIVGTLSRPRGWPYFAYPKLPGTPLHGLRQLSGRGRMRLGRFLGQLFHDLDRCPTGKLLSIGVLRGSPRSDGERFDQLRRRFRRVAASHLSKPLRDRVEDALDRIQAILARSRYRSVLIHGDLWPSHILWDRQDHRPTAVIDWEDARLGDPAADLVAFGDLGSEVLADVGEHRRQHTDRLFWERVSLYREILPLWGYLFGLETKDRAIRDQHLAELKSSLRG